MRFAFVIAIATSERCSSSNCARCIAESNAKRSPSRMTDNRMTDSRMTDIDRGDSDHERHNETTEALCVEVLRKKGCCRPARPHGLTFAFMLIAALLVFILRQWHAHLVTHVYFETSLPMQTMRNTAGNAGSSSTPESTL